LEKQPSLSRQVGQSIFPLEKSFSNHAITNTTHPIYLQAKLDESEILRKLLVSCGSIIRISAKSDLTFSHLSIKQKHDN